MASDIPEITGHELVDAIQGVQILADSIDETGRKLEYVRSALRVLRAGELIGHQFMISCSSALAAAPDLPKDEKRFYQNGMVFVAELQAYAYMLDHDVPIDSLAINFVSPEVIGCQPDEAQAMRVTTLQIPVLAIDSCMSAEAA